MAVVMPVAVAVVALTAGLALLTFVKAYGIAFLARPRGEGAAAAHESGLRMRVAMVVAASTVVVLGLAPGRWPRRPPPRPASSGVGSVGWWGIDLSGIDALLDPVALSLVALPWSSR